jgi:pSer/pThr/pTyr-binding forkhead associated (FHA) protein
MPYLSVIHPETGAELDRVELRGGVTVGRMTSVADWVVRDPAVSRRHCRVEPEGEGWVLSDLESFNGTRVNEEEVARRVLQDGDVIRIGRTALRFHAGPMPRRARPAHPGEAMAIARAARGEADRRTMDHLFPRPQPRRVSGESDGGNAPGLSDTSVP